MNEYLKHLWRLENWFHVLLGLSVSLCAWGLFLIHPTISFAYSGIAFVWVRELSQRQMKVKLTTGAPTAHFFSNWFDWSKKQQMELIPTIVVLGGIACLTLIL